MDHQIVDRDWKQQVPASTQDLSRVGFCTLGVFILLFLIWGAFFPISSAVVALGTIIPAGNVKTVEHQTGGAVAKLHAKNGDVVQAGDPIVTLDPIVDQASLDQLKSRQLLLMAIEARLVAEIQDADEVTFPAELTAPVADESTGDGSRANGLTSHFISDQRKQFETRRRTMEDEISGLHKQINAIEEEKHGLETQRTSLDRQYQSLAKQLKRMRPLLDKGLFARNDAEELERERIALGGQARATKFAISSADYRIKELQKRIDTTLARARAESASQLAEVRGELASIHQQITAADDVLAKREVRAPVGGILTKLVVHAPGEVVVAGEAIGEIVPSSGHIVSARVTPQDIDDIHLEESAQVVITAFNNVLFDPLESQVSYIAADSAQDEQTGETYFDVHLTLLDSPTYIEKASSLRSGMRCDVYITTGERSFFGYILRPLLDSFRRSFREA